MKNDLRAFFEAIRIHFGRIPLVAVIERGAENGRLHVHFAANCWLDDDVVERLWRRGFVHVRGPRPTSRRWGIKHLAAYLAKYVSKDLDPEPNQEAADRADRCHRYLLTQGFTPTAWSWRFRHPDHAWAMAAVLLGDPCDWGEFGLAHESVVWGWWLSWPDD